MGSVSYTHLKRGIIDVLRKGVKVYPASLVLFYMTPSVNNPSAAQLHAKNIFSVTRQLHFSCLLYTSRCV